MSYLVTGGMGLIGSHIIKLLIREGEKRVTAYDTDARTILLDHLMSDEERSRVEVVQGDVTDLPKILHTAQKYDVDKIIHMAYLLTVASAANPPLALRVNCEGTLNVLETARILKLKKVVWASSVAVFGPPGIYKDEYIPNDAPHYPSSIYGASKSFNEVLAKHYFNEFGVDSSGLRFNIVYGAGQMSGISAVLTEELMVKPALGKPGRVPCGNDTINWLYVEDAARAAVMASKKAATKATAFNVGGDVRSVAELADYVRRLIPKAQLTLLPGYIGFPAKYDCALIKEEVGYEPQWSVEQGVKKVIAETQRGRHN